jgi:alpha-galactosidase
MKFYAGETMSAESAPHVLAQFTSHDLPADDLDATAWGSAAPVWIKRRWSGEPAPLNRHAEVRILWSNDALHVRFVCEQHEPLIVNPNPQTRNKTPGLWDRDVCEIFLAPDPARPENYFEIEAAPTGEWIDLGITWEGKERVTNWEFKSELSVATRVEPERLVVAMRIPWSVDGKSIHKPRLGELWLVNLFRCVGLGNDRYLAWQPTFSEEPNFHVPQAFGWLRFE